jgi:uncharacterized protein (DUF2236 family)
MTTDADPGLFGPDSVTWQLHADPMMWVAGVRALYLQALHPRAVRGVMQNSDFREDPWGRLLRTADFIGTTTYGSTDEAREAGERVRRIHASLKAVDPGTGITYRIDEPELLRWIHCAEVSSYLEVVRRSGFALTDEQVDRYFAEQVLAAELVGLQRGFVPGSAAETARYLEEVRPALAVTEEAQQVWEFLRRPPVPVWLWAGREVLWRQVAELAYASLPPWARKLYGHRGLPEPVTTAGLRGTRVMLQGIGPVIRMVRPSPHIGAALARLGPHAAPSPDRLPAG